MGLEGSSLQSIEGFEPSSKESRGRFRDGREAIDAVAAWTPSLLKTDEILRG